MIRDPIPDDLDYFVGAGRKYCSLIGLDFDEAIFVRSLTAQLENEFTKFFILDGKAHCIVTITHSGYGKNIIARIISTWGPGGTKCLRAAKQWAKEQGADKIIADANLSPKIAKFYESIGMKEYDTNYMGSL